MSFLSVTVLTKFVKVLAGTLAAAFTGLLATLYIKYRNDWQAIRRLRKGNGGCCRYYLLCGLLNIFLGCFYCWCYSCCTRKRKKGPTNSNRSTVDDEIGEETINDWIYFINNEAEAITTTIFEDMKNNYRNYQYKHQYYCYKNGEKCNPSECEHKTSRKCKGLLKNPILYLVELDFDASIRDSLNKYEGTNKTMKDLYDVYCKQNPLEFLFKVAFSKNEMDRSAFTNIQGNWDKKSKNVCIVATNFPTKNDRPFGEGEKLLLQSLFQLHKKYNVQLIYNVR